MIYVRVNYLEKSQTGPRVIMIKKEENELTLTVEAIWKFKINSRSNGVESVGEMEPTNKQLEIHLSEFFNKLVESK